MSRLQASRDENDVVNEEIVRDDALALASAGKASGGKIEVATLKKLVMG